MRCAGEDPEENCGGELEFLRKRGVEPTAEEIANHPKKPCVDCDVYAPALCPLHRPAFDRDIEQPKEEKKPVPRKDDEEEPDFPEHSLFPYPDDEDGFDVSFIQVTRWENGKHVWGPVFPASEIPDELALIELFGGGQYVLIARQPQKRDKSKPGNETKRRKITLPGRSKPFSSDPTVEEEVGHVSAPAPSAPSMTGGGGFEQILIAMMNMQQQAQAREAESSKEFMTMFLGMMNASKADTQNMMTMMMNLSSQQQQSMMQLLPTLMGSRGGGPDEMAKFAELFKTLGFTPPAAGGKVVAKDDDNSIGAILANGADVLQGIVALRGGLGGGALPTNGEVQSPALPGSAAEMFDRMKRGG